MVANFPNLSARAGLIIGALAFLQSGTLPISSAAQSPSPRSGQVGDSRQVCLNSTANPDDRIPACTRLIESKPNDADLSAAFQTRGHVWSLKRNFDAAISDFKSAINYNLKSTQARHELGDSYFNKGEFRSAIMAYSDALALEKSAQLYNNRGAAQVNIGEFDSAINDFGEAIEINRNFASAYNNRGDAYLRYNKFELAIE